MQKIRVSIPAGRYEKFSKDAASHLAGKKTTFIDENNVRHSATIVYPIFTTDEQITITLDVPDEAAIESMKVPLTGISIGEGDQVWFRNSKLQAGSE